jgi:hypothetical protein
MRKNDDVQDIVSQLRNLQLQQATLISRLERLSESGTAAHTDTAREFAIGDWVKINNPGLFKATKGKIVRIGATRITVESTGGKKIVRSPKNLTLIEDERRY